MAGDWIKMRLELQTHPKIVRILSATKSDKFRVIGGLHAVWSVFDTHSTDGRLDGYTPETLDHIIGWNGFSDAMIAVGWLALDGEESLMLPEFDEHNGKSGKRRAEDTKRKRDDRKNPQNVRNLSEYSADKNGTREEKRRVNTTEPSAPKFDSVAELKKRGVQDQTASDWLDLRKKKRCPLTATALSQIIGEADAAGMSLERALAISCRQGWAGFKASWLDGENAKEPAKLPRREVVL